jgi:hypothetical protein
MIAQYSWALFMLSDLFVPDSCEPVSLYPIAHTNYEYKITVLVKIKILRVITNIK